MKVHADRRRTNGSYAVGDMVYVNLQPYGLLSLKDNSFQKLAANSEAF